MAKAYQGNKPATTPKAGEFENYIADEFGQATINCIRKGEELGFEKRQIRQIMGFALKQLGKSGAIILSTMMAEMTRVAKDITDKKNASRIPIDPKTLKPRR